MSLGESLRTIETEIAAGRAESALAQCQEAQTQYPRALSVQRVLGETYLSLRKPREALAALERVLAGDPEDARALCARALVYQMHGDSQAALQWYRRACDVRPEDQVLQFLAFPDIKVAPEKRLAIYEALSLINEQLWLGHFEMWSGSGLVLFRHSTILDTREDEGLSLEQAEAIAEAAVEECERFYPVFQFVLWGGKSPGEAIAAALIDTHGEA